MTPLGAFAVMGLTWDGSEGDRAPGAGPGATLRGGGLSDAPLAAGAFDDVRGGVALAAGVLVSLAAALRGLQVVGRAAEERLPQVVEQVAREEHVDPGVAAAVQAAQEHGDDERHG